MASQPVSKQGRTLQFNSRALHEDTYDEKVVEELVIQLPADRYIIMEYLAAGQNAGHSCEHQ